MQVLPMGEGASEGRVSAGVLLTIAGPHQSQAKREVAKGSAAGLRSASLVALHRSPLRDLIPRS
jgi:hypothetical protein